MRLIHRALSFAIALVWLFNGLCCKVLAWVPRHQEIVARILGNDRAPLLTGAIGISEIIMTVWVLSRFRSRLCAATQITVILTMNVLEFFLVPDLLLFGRWNLLFAFLLCAVIAVHELTFRNNPENRAVA
jgi:hypothetical protein